MKHLMTNWKRKTHVTKFQRSGVKKWRNRILTKTARERKIFWNLRSDQSLTVFAWSPNLIDKFDLTGAMHCNDCLPGNKSLDAWLSDSKRRCKDCPFPATDTLIGNCKELSKSVKIFIAFEVKILPHIQYLPWHCLPGKGEGMINIGILSSSLRQRHFQHSNLGGWIDYREISGRGLVRRYRPYMFASLSKLHPSEWEVLGFEAQHGKFPLNHQIHSFRFKMLAQILGSKLSNDAS